ncbi:hypothetical protein CANINC_000371 [Pichia inconspicua]|uniref:Pre-rRNA-processing protein FHL1 n=1 Tax=Pichia inconspicua TaxID=52247 RepID=A0A4V4NG82_9ASCO|nr:hypothetical protein CANINC_000371 [[Candida] inconspicua]
MSLSDNTSTAKHLNKRQPDYEEFQTAPFIADEVQPKIESSISQSFEQTQPVDKVTTVSIVKFNSVQTKLQLPSIDTEDRNGSVSPVEQTTTSPEEKIEETNTGELEKTSKHNIQSHSEQKNLGDNENTFPPPVQPPKEEEVEPVIPATFETAPIINTNENSKVEPEKIQIQSSQKQLEQLSEKNIEQVDKSKQIPDEMTKIKEEETETVHLHESPQDLHIKKSSFGENMVKSTTNTKNENNAKTEDNNSVSKLETGMTAPEEQKIQAYAMLDFESFTFYIQTMQILLGRMVEGDSSTEALDIHLGNQKAISRRHAKIFYNFGNQRFELSILGRNGAFVEGNFVEKGVTVPLQDGTKIQIGETEFAFILPKKNDDEQQQQVQNALNSGDVVVEAKKSAKNKDIHLENIDKLVANFDDIKKDLEIEKILLPPTPSGVGLIDEDHAKRELEIEEEIGRVLAREHGEQVMQDDKKSKKKSSSKVKSESDKTKPKRQPKAKKKVYTLEEIPEEYRNKPNLPYSVLITDCLRKRGTERGMSLSEIYKGIQELYPYYFYCPDGWQSSVRHNLSLNKSFKKISKEGKGWLWGVNEEVIAEKDRARQKQLENAKAKGKLSAKTIPRSMISHGEVPRPPNPNIPIQISNYTVPQQHKQTQQQLQHTQPFSRGQASKQQPILSVQPQKPITNAKNITTTTTTTTTTAGVNTNSTSNAIKPVATSSKPDMNATTKRALAYLQKELIALTKARKMYDRETSTEILTKALAMTISQVDQAAKNFAIKGFPLATLIDKNPGHVTKILTAALNAATSQVCKRKGLTPHLPPKTTASTTTTTVAAKATTTTSTSTGMTNSASASSTVANVRAAPVEAKFVASPQQQQLAAEQRSGPSVQGSGSVSVAGSGSVSGSTITPTPTPFVPKPIAKSGPVTSSVGKPSLGKGPVMYQFKENNGEGIVKPVFGVSNKNSGIVKPQFYAKGRQPVKNDDKKDDGDGDGDGSESEGDGEIDKMLADLEKDVESSDGEDEEGEEGNERKKQRVI